MIKVENYPNAYKEVYEILKAVPKEDFDKIPTEFMQIVKKNMNVRDRVLIGFLILRKNYDEIGRALGINEEQVKERVYNLREKIECLFPELFNK